MDKHQVALGKITRSLIAFDPTSSWIAVGSIGRGDYHAASDIDMVVICDKGHRIPGAVQWEEDCWREFADPDGDPAWGVDGIEVHLACQTFAGFEETIMRRPVWRFEAKKILRDPSGIAAWAERCVAQFKEDNPQLLELWTDLQNDYKLWKADHRHPRKFEHIEDFMDGIDYSGAVFRYGRFGKTKTQ